LPFKSLLANATYAGYLFLVGRLLFIRKIPRKIMASSLARIKSIALAGQFAALTAVGSFIVIPVGPVPFTLQTFFVYLAGLCLGPKNAAFAMIIYISAGLLGLPVFAGGKAGIGVLLGPTGGYLPGFVCAACLAGLATLQKKYTARNSAAWLAIAVLSLHICGILGLWIFLRGAFLAALIMGLPFVAVDTIKAGFSFYVWRRISYFGRRP
jgi:biotin transport system substrate-specific component